MEMMIQLTNHLSFFMKKNALLNTLVVGIICDEKMWILEFAGFY